MAYGSVRDRLQRCRSELGQLTGLARDIERGGDGRFSASWGDGWARRDGQCGDAARRIGEVAERCTALLSDIEREIEGSARGFGFEGVRGGWDRETPYGEFEGPRRWQSGYGTQTYGGYGSQAGYASGPRPYGRDLIGASGRSYPRY